MRPGQGAAASGEGQRRGEHPLAQLHVVAGVPARAHGIGQRRGGLAHAHGHRAGGAGLGQRVVVLGMGAEGGAGEEGEGEQLAFHQEVLRSGNGVGTFGHSGVHAGTRAGLRRAIASRLVPSKPWV